MKNLLETISQNVGHVFAFLGTVVFMFVITYVIEKLIQKREGSKERLLSTKKVTVIGMFSALSGILMLFEFPIPFLAPGFYKLDFSELPVLICSFAYGPVAGVFTEFCKILLKLLFKSTETAFVGELANFAVGCALIVPASIIYRLKRTKKMAVISCITGTVVITLFGAVFNALYLLPAFAVLYFGDVAALNTFVEMGHAINPMINSIFTFALFAVAPLNFLKGAAISTLTLASYKKISPILKDGHTASGNQKSVKQ